MAHKGQIIYNNVTGETITFLECAADTAGKLLAFELVLKPGSTVPMKHTHTEQDEVFETVSGEVNVTIGGDDKIINEGEKVVMPKNIPHKWWNATGNESKLIVSFSPACNTEDFFVEMFALANAGKTKPNGAPTFLQAAVLCGKYNIYHPTIPVFLQKTVSHIVRIFIK